MSSSFRPRLDKKYSHLSNEEIELILEAKLRKTGGSKSEPVMFFNKEVQPGRAIIPQEQLDALAKDSSLQSLLTELQDKLDEATFTSEDFASETTLASIKTVLDNIKTQVDKIISDTDDNSIAASQTVQIVLSLPYTYDSTAGVWKRQEQSDQGIEIDISGIGGTSLDASSSLGALGTGLVAGIGGTAGNLLAIDSNGNLKVVIVDSNGDEVTDPTYAFLKTRIYGNLNNAFGQVNTNQLKVTLYDTAGDSPAVDNLQLDNLSSRFSLWTRAVQVETSEDGSYFDRVKHSFYQELTGINTNAQQTVLDISTTPMHQFTLIVVNEAAITTQGTVYIQGSLDNSNWIDLVGSTGGGTASGDISNAKWTTSSWRYIRARTTGYTFGTGTIKTQLLASAR